MEFFIMIQSLEHVHNIAIIPARGGSKRIPHKNIKDFLGKPIIAYSIEAAINSGLFDEVMVSTDDEEISEISKKYKAEVPFLRSKITSGDFSTTSEVLVEVLSRYEKLGEKFDYICCIYATAPFVTQEKITKSYEFICDNKADSVFPVVKFGYPIQRAVRILPNNRVEYIWPENSNRRSQDLEPAYHDVGQFYWINGKSFSLSHSIVSKNSRCIEIPAFEEQDIDTENDWLLAEQKYRNLKEKGLL